MLQVKAGHICRLDESRLVRRLLVYKGSSWRFAARALNPNSGQGHGHRGWHSRWERPLEQFALAQWNDVWLEAALAGGTAQWNGVSHSFAAFHA